MKTCFTSALKSNVGKVLFNYVQQEKDQMRRLRVSLQAGGGTIHERTYLAACELAELMLKGE